MRWIYKQADDDSMDNEYELHDDSGFTGIAVQCGFDGSCSVNDYGPRFESVTFVSFHNSVAQAKNAALRYANRAHVS